MARPRKEGLDYFPHDCDLDDKFDSLELLYQNDGYAFGFKLYQRIYKTSDGILQVSDAEMRQVLAAECHVSVERWEQILASALKFRLFDPKIYAETGGLTSKGIQKRRSVVVRHREYSRSQNDSEQVSYPVSESETPHKTPESKAKKTKEKETKENTPCSPPGDEVQVPLPEKNQRTEELFDLYRQNIDLVTPPIRERIRYWESEFGFEKVCSAIREAAISATKNPNYIQRVLENNKNNGHFGAT